MADLKTKLTKGAKPDTIFINKLDEDGYFFERIIIEHDGDAVCINLIDIDAFVKKINKFKIS